MARWWTRPSIIIAVLGTLAVIITAFLPQTPITQPRSGAGSPAIGSADRDVTIPQRQSPVARIWDRMKRPPVDTSTPPGQPWWQELPVIVALIAGIAAIIVELIGAIATLGAALISRQRTTPPTETKE